MKSKLELVFNVMDMLEGEYKNNSKVYKQVEGALLRLSNLELRALYSMLLCEIKIKS